jgi:hypothetical protein
MAEGNSVKRSTSRFRMHQILKLREQEVIFLPFIMPLFLSHVFQQRFELVERIMVCPSEVLPFICYYFL